MTRDPRIEPKPGDIIRKGTANRVLERHVVRRDGGNIYYTAQNSAVEKCAWITTWRAWAKDVVVVRAA